MLKVRASPPGHRNRHADLAGKLPEECVVCTSKYVSYVRDVPTLSAGVEIPLFYCMECESFTNPSGFLPTAETDATELAFHIKVHERNVLRSRALLREMKKQYPDLQRIVEIGCGTGSFVREAQDMGFDAVGYDINEQAVAYGVEQYGANISASWWNSDLQTEPFDMLFCIMVLEHLEQPRDLFTEMVVAARRFGAGVFVAVPALNRNRWKYILDPDPTRPGTPFFNNRAHVTHFSNIGLHKLAEQFEAGIREVRSNVSENEIGWGGFVYEFQSPG